MSEVVIVEAGRSPIGKRDGGLAAAHPADILGPVMMEVLERAGVASSEVGQVVGGCINKVGAQAMNITRTAWLSHGGAEEVAATTVDAQCGSSQHAVNTAYSLIASGVEDVVLACGVESMSTLPIGSDAVAGAKAGLGKPVSRSYFENYEFTSQFEGPSASPRSTTSAGTTPTASVSSPRSGPPGPSPRAASRPRSSRSTPPSSTRTARRPARPSPSPPTRSPATPASSSWPS